MARVGFKLSKRNVGIAMVRDTTIMVNPVLVAEVQDSQQKKKSVHVKMEKDIFN